jgi:hypothetical protein
MNNTQSHPSTLTGRCEYLGLKDDPRTCLAFPSNWNYCYHTRRPESVRLEYQRQFCQTPDHVSCPVFQNEKAGSLPPGARARHEHKKRPLNWFVKISAALFVLALALIIFWLAQSPLLLTGIKSSLFGKPNVNGLPFETLPVLSFVISTPLTKSPSQVVTSDPDVISTSTVVFVPSDNSLTTMASGTFAPSPAAICGHPLDIPFGVEHQFVIHQAQNGDSLDMYANNFHTSVDVIRAVNSQLPIPLRKDWVLVIPIGETQLDSSVPAFEPYLVSETNSSITTLAAEFSTDPIALKQYNDLDESCQAFSGWLLIPQ